MNIDTKCDLYMCYVMSVPGKIIKDIQIVHAWVNKKNIKQTIAFNLSPPTATYIHQWIGPALVQTMASPLFSTKPLFKQMMGYC